MVSGVWVEWGVLAGEDSGVSEGFEEWVSEGLEEWVSSESGVRRM